MAIRVKFKSRKNMILLPAAADGRDLTNFVLDTGAGRTVVDSEYYRGDTTAESVRAKVLGGGGTADAGAGTVSKLTIAGIADGVADGTSAVAEDMQVIVMDLSHLRKALGVPLGGIVGANFLRDFKVTIDYRRRIVEFDPFPVSKARQVARSEFRTKVGLTPRKARAKRKRTK